MLILSNVRKSVSGAKDLFHGLNLELSEGEILVVIGESGVGKSTLLNLIAGLDRPDAGQILLDGIDVSALNETQATLMRRAKIGFVFQAFHLLPYLDLAQNVGLPLRLNGKSAHEAIARAEQCLANVGIARERWRDLPASLSGGEMQRVAIARALCHHPVLLLADEPTGSLDPDSAWRVLDVLESQARETRTAVLLVTHSALAARRADRILRLTGAGFESA